MGTLHMNVNKFLGTFSDVLNMMMDVGILTSHVFSYSVAQDMTNMVVEERHLQSFIKFLEEAKGMLSQLSNQHSQSRSKEGFENMVLGFEGQQSIVTESITVAGAERKAHGNSFGSSCATATYSPMKSSELDVRFSANSQQQYGNMNESGCEIPPSRFSPLDDSQYNAGGAALSRSRHYSVPDNSSCYDMRASTVGHDNSLSTHTTAFNLPNHMVVNPHFQPSCESSFNGSTNQMMPFPSCGRDTSLKQYPPGNETQSHEPQYVTHDKTQDFSSKPSCEFAQPNEACEPQQHFTSPRGHFSPTAESNCDTLYASRCDTTQDAHFSCDTTYETSNHSGRGMHTSSVPFQSTSEQTMSAHYSHPTLPAENGFGNHSKTQHGSAFSMINSMSTTQYSSCQGTSDKAQYTTSENPQNKMHYPQRNDICEASFSQMNSSNGFVGVNNGNCNPHVTSRSVDDARYTHVASFKWGVLSDTEDSFDPSSPVQPSHQNQDTSEFEDLGIAFANQVNKEVAMSDLKRNSGERVTVEPSESSFSSLLGTRDIRCLSDENKKKISILDGAKQEGGKWKCPLCEKLFIARVNMDRHFNVSHLGEKAFPCTLCEKGFSSKIRLDAHLMRQHNLACDTANPCSVCGKMFNTKSALKTHSLTHVDESEKPFACHICNKRFSQKVVLETHLVRHGGPATYKYHCKICSKSFPTKPKLKFHWRKHENAQLSCKQCSKQFPNESLLRAHEATHVGLAQRPFPCTQCPKTFTTKHKLQSHLETHGQSCQYSCTDCSAVFKCRSTLVAHMRRRHPKSETHLSGAVTDCSESNATFPNPQQISQVEHSQGLNESLTFKCPVCLKVFTRKSNLRQHELSCHQDVPRRFPCEQCPKRFKSKAKLKIHLATHNEEPNLSCATCGKRFYRSDLLRTHEATHTGNKPFSCDVCARRFATQAMLRSHQVIHQPPPETVVEVPCPTCGKKFKNKRTLALHVKCHADSLDFKCSTCGKQFARRVHYDGHMRTHSADRPYSCTVCNRTFRERKHRADHMRRLHPNEVLGGGELTLQKLIDSITADDTLDASATAGSFETDVNSDALASLTELSNSGMQQLLENSSQRNIESHLDDTSQSQGSQMNTGFGSQTRVLSMESPVEAINPNTQVNILSQSFTSQTHNVSLDCQANISEPSQVNNLPAAFNSQSQSLPILQNPFHHLKGSGSDTLPFGCSGNGELNPLSDLSDQLQSIESHSCSHSGLHYGHSNEGNKANPSGAPDESLPKLSDVLAISMGGDI